MTAIVSALLGAEASPVSQEASDDFTLYPGGHNPGHFPKHLFVGSAGPNQNAKGMVGTFYRPEPGRFSQALDDTSKAAGFSECVARSLKEELGNMDAAQMRRPFDRGLVGRGKRKPQKDETPDMGQRLQRLRLRGHATAKRFAAREQRERRRQFGRPLDRRSHRRGPRSRRSLRVRRWHSTMRAMF